LPNRILKESICTSDNLDRLSPEQEVLFYRLVVHCDDFGRFDGRPRVIRAACFPLKDEVTPEMVVEWLSSLVAAELVRVYEVAGKPYIQFVTWDRHQQIRAKRSKFPDPNAAPQASDSGCRHSPADVPVIQSESNPNPNPKVLVGEADRCDPIDEARDEVMAHLNAVTGRTGPSTFTSHGGVKERLRAGVPLTDLMLVVDFKAAEWSSCEKMRPYIRPKTLFSPENFPAYLSEAKDWEARGRPPMARDALSRADDKLSLQRATVDDEDMAAFNRALEEKQARMRVKRSTERIGETEGATSGE
jgi:uncharacterized phage protein (TIGR02220 family)